MNKKHYLNKQRLICKNTELKKQADIIYCFPNAFFIRKLSDISYDAIPGVVDNLLNVVLSFHKKKQLLISFKAHKPKYVEP